MYQLSCSKMSLLVKNMLCGKSSRIFSASFVSSSIGSVPKPNVNPLLEDHDCCSRSRSNSMFLLTFLRSCSSSSEPLVALGVDCARRAHEDKIVEVPWKFTPYPVQTHTLHPNGFEPTTNTAVASFGFYERGSTSGKFNRQSLIRP